MFFKNDKPKTRFLKRIIICLLCLLFAVVCYISMQTTPCSIEGIANIHTPACLGMNEKSNWMKNPMFMVKRVTFDPTYERLAKKSAPYLLLAKSDIPQATKELIDSTLKEMKEADPLIEVFVLLKEKDGSKPVSLKTGIPYPSFIVAKKEEGVYRILNTLIWDEEGITLSYPITPIKCMGEGKIRCYQVEKE